MTQQNGDRLWMPGGPLLGPHTESIEGVNGRPEQFGDSVDAALTSPGGRRFGPVGEQGQASESEEVLECPGDGAHQRAVH